MDRILLAFALAANTAAACGYYLSAPRQQWLAQAPSAGVVRALRLGSSALLAAALCFWLRMAHLSTALFAVLSITMLLFAVLPYLAAWRTLRSAARAGAGTKRSTQP
ncbi:hypothetical protein ASD15_03305 [Massilia sp. Root351]|jgi:hypothetical protein|uniref:hypothetical protein n=1 Tax=Massilia sp. Root351 TaxID=1736522 RepID=UPI00070F08EE|nr:hypothetical protein [Massilia sp. Root351]KQV91090.1 hypothetical protein ASD15_03305 [Massilia sp. Root351]